MDGVVLCILKKAVIKWFILLLLEINASDERGKLTVIEKTRIVVALEDRREQKVLCEQSTHLSPSGLGFVPF